MTLKRKKLTGSEKRAYKHRDEPAPKGSERELAASLEKTLEHQMKILDYSDKEVFPEEVLAEQRRLVHYGVKGPRRGYSVVYERNKLWQADVLYILTVTIPSKLLAEKYGVSHQLVNRIRQGKEECWGYEFRLIRRLKTAVRNNINQLRRNTKNVYVLYGIHTKQGEILHVITSIRKAEQYLKDLYDKKDGYYIKQLEVWS